MSSQTLSKFPHPADYEPRISKLWQQHQCFEISDEHTTDPIYTILMPPPNVTSQLHMGHGTGYTLQDWFVRWKRMSEGRAAWICGLDHAGIATQMMVEKQLLSEGTDKHEIGREAFIVRAKAWKEKYGHQILDQFKAMGFSCDYSNIAYTLDEPRSRGVRYAFWTLYNKGLIYRGKRLVNWDPSLQTALGDDEVENRQVAGALHELIYPLADGSGKVIVATTRPETMFGDMAVAVHPTDPRYMDMVGKLVIVPLINRTIPIIADSYVKQDFGTGALKITPAHDENDYEIGKRHDLDMIMVLDEHGCLCGDVPESFKGLDRFVARKAVIKALKDQSCYHKSHSYTYSVPHSSRSGAIIEPKLCSQWFVRASEMAKQAAQAARDDEICFYPKNWKKTWLYWLDNIRDWCISRQLWWGHRIPIWTCNHCHHVFSSLEDPSCCEKCGHTELLQDEDVLDTWFSSWLWPLSPFGWPDHTQNLKPFYPSAVLITGPDIIFQWVARMTMAGLTFHGQLPFHHVLFTAIVCDKQGRKFSKTLGNGIDPMDVIDSYGADALRFTTAFMAPQGGKIKMEISDFKLGQNFVHKIWQASRYVKSICDGLDSECVPLRNQSLNTWQKGLLHELAVCADQVKTHLNLYNTHEAVRALYQYSWNALCDWGIEACKSALKHSTDHQQQLCQSVMVYAHESALRLLHPLIPFVTEELWTHLPSHPDLKRGPALCVSEYPQDLERYPSDHAHWLMIQQISHKIRGLKQNFKIPQSVSNQLNVYVKIHATTEACLSDDESCLICDLAHINKLYVVNDDQNLPRQSLVDCTLTFELAIPIADHVDLWAEKQGDESLLDFLRQTLQDTQGYYQKVQKKLQNQAFLEKADPQIIENTKTHSIQLVEKITALQKSLDSFSNPNHG